MEAADVSVRIAVIDYRLTTTSKMTPPIYSLPLELINAIIDKIYNDSDTTTARRTLRSCGLVSRIFVDRTREHLFREITIRSNIKCKEFLAFSAHIHSSTTSLTILFKLRRGRKHTLANSWGLPSLFHVLHNVNTITLFGMEWKSLHPAFVNSLTSRSFLSITLMHTHFPDSQAFCSFLSHSPNLRQFSCLMTTIDSSDRPPFSANFDASCRPHITDMSFRKMRQIPEMVLSPTLSPLNLDRLRVLDVFLHEDLQFDLARRFMDLTTQSLKVLRVSQFRRPPTDRSEYLPIQRLRSITIEMDDYHLRGRIILPIELSIFNWWIGHFESYPTMHCCCVHLLVRIFSYEVEASADYTAWKKLDIALSRTSIRSLVVDLFISKIVRIVSPETSPIKLVIEENLPILMGRKIAHVQVGAYNNDNGGRNFIVDHP
ncbi:hypothetical protein ARMSODRAFT_665078 [Armillaria solidipes]|uniref:F-box domain-containing protein n=1 Tax=Armillaria solidipes TaxID=1076256 RepID=A0A2H3BC48_9AGAR|nr:hypothetical protein ARMSODRAFT_665078 [Armillaria solidipes]